MGQGKKTQKRKVTVLVTVGHEGAKRRRGYKKRRERNYVKRVNQRSD